MLERGTHVKAKLDTDFIISEIKYWREFVLFALTHTGEEILKYEHVQIVPNCNIKNEQRPRSNKKDLPASEKE